MPDNLHLQYRGKNKKLLIYGLAGNGSAAYKEIFFSVGTMKRITNELRTPAGSYLFILRQAPLLLLPPL